MQIFGSFCAGTSTPTTSPPSDNTVSFLGMELSPSDAETGLYTTFALLIVALIVAVCSSCCFLKAKKHSKNQYSEEYVNMNKQF